MDISKIVCTYIYNSFEIISDALEAFKEIAIGLMDRMEMLAQALNTTWEYTISKFITVLIDMIRVYEKKLVDWIYNPKEDTPAFCASLWECLSFVQTMLDPGSLLFRKLEEWLNKQCKTIKPAYTSIQALLSDYTNFKNIVCSYGFSYEFGIGIIKEILIAYKAKLIEFANMIKKKVSQIKGLVIQYVNWIMDIGVSDYLEKLEGLFKCVLDSSEICSNIATARNYYDNVCADMGIEKTGDTWDMTAACKNYLYGSMEGNTTMINNARTELDLVIETIASPEKTERAVKAFNLSKNIFPGGVNWSDVTTDEGKLSWTKLTSAETWKKNKIVKKYKQTYDEIKEVIEKSVLKTDIETQRLLNNTSIDSDGNIYYNDGCQLHYIRTSTIDTPYEVEYYSTGSGSDEVLIDGNEIISVTEAAVKIHNDPESNLAKECEKIWRTLNSWSNNTDIMKKYK